MQLNCNASLAMQQWQQLLELLVNYNSLLYMLDTMLDMFNNLCVLYLWP